MNNTRKASAPKQDKRLVRAYSEIFRGLYWRHEFARRNDAVSNASRDLAKALGFKATRFDSFIQDSRPLSDELVDICKTGSKAAKTALRDFLEKHKVLPTTWTLQSKASYFPMEFGLADRERENYIFDTVRDCRKIFNSLLLFEACSMSDLEMGHPVMFPLMPLVVFGRSIEHLHLDNFSAPVLLDRFAPVELIGHYSDALDHEMEWSQHEKKAEKNAAKSSRIPWESFPSFVHIYGNIPTVKEGEKPTGFKIDYYAKHMDCPRIKPVKDLAANAIASYDSQLNAAKFYRDHYEEIL